MAPIPSILNEFRPGHLFWMPAGSTWLNQDKPRPFALVTPSSPGTLATLVYGSTQETEKRSGAACVGISPVHGGLNLYGDDAARETEHVVDEHTLARIDDALCRFFALGEAPQGS